MKTRAEKMSLEVTIILFTVETGKFFVGITLIVGEKL